MGEKEDVCTLLFGIPLNERPLRRGRRKRDDSIKMNLKAIGCGDVKGTKYLCIGFNGRLM
jgi:hypothetical protein